MNDFNPPRAHSVGSVLALLALVIMALGIGALTYQSRVLRLEGEFWQWFSLVVAFAPTASTLVIAWYKLFAVSDEAHDQTLWVAFGIDMLGITMQLVGVGLYVINAQDEILLGIRVLSFACSGLALIAVALAAGSSGYRKIKIQQHQRAVDFQTRFNELFKEALNRPEIATQMLALAMSLIDEQARALTGHRTLASPPVSLEDIMKAMTALATDKTQTNLVRNFTDASGAGKGTGNGTGDNSPK